jgi:hypothetical protein
MEVMEETGLKDSETAGAAMAGVEVWPHSHLKVMGTRETLVILIRTQRVPQTG